MTLFMNSSGATTGSPIYGAAPQLLWRLLFIALFCCLAVPAAANSGLQGLSAQLDRQEVTLGDTLQLAVHLETSGEALFSLPPRITLAPFELRSTRLDTTATTLDLRLELQALALGRQTLPPVTIYYATADTSAAAVSDSFAVTVSSPLIPGDTALRDAMTLKTGSIPYMKWLGWLGLVLFALLLFGGLIGGWLYQRHRRTDGPAALPPDPYALFLVKMEQVGRLLQGEPSLKEVYTLMTEALKHLILAKDGIDTTGLPTRETLADPGIRAWPEDDVRELALLLCQADLVKFAKARPNRETVYGDKARLAQLAQQRYGGSDSDAV